MTKTKHFWSIYRFVTKNYRFLFILVFCRPRRSASSSSVQPSLGAVHRALFDDIVVKLRPNWMTKIQSNKRKGFNSMRMRNSEIASIRKKLDEMFVCKSLNSDLLVNNKLKISNLFPRSTQTNFRMGYCNGKSFFFFNFDLDNENEQRQISNRDWTNIIVRKVNPSHPFSSWE